MSGQYLHIDYRPGGSWLLPIMARLYQSSSSTLRERMNAWGETPLQEMGLALATKLRMVPHVVRRLEIQLGRLAEELSDLSGVDECLRRGAAFTVRDDDLPYELLVDLDSFLFESRSAYEIVGNFLRQFFELILGKRIDEATLQTLLTAENVDTRWIEELRESRILFFHRTAPWIAVRIVSKQPLRFELIVLKKSVKSFDSPDDFLEFGRLRAVYQGFKTSLGFLHSFVIRQIEEFEAKERGGKP